MSKDNNEEARGAVAAVRPFPFLCTVEPSVLDVLIGMEDSGYDVYRKGDQLALVQLAPWRLPGWLEDGLYAHRRELLARLSSQPRLAGAVLVLHIQIAGGPAGGAEGGCEGK